MTESPLDILLFGDQTGDYTAVFRSLLQNVDDVYLKAFLDKIYLTLREEVFQQPLSFREQIPGFTSIIDLVARYAEPDVAKSNAIESALTCISQVACFFMFVLPLSNRPSTNITTAIRVRELSRIHPQPAHALSDLVLAF